MAKKEKKSGGWESHAREAIANLPDYKYPSQAPKGGFILSLFLSWAVGKVVDRIYRDKPLPPMLYKDEE